MRNDSLPSRSKSPLSAAQLNASPNRLVIAPESASFDALTIEVTEEDVRWAARSGLRNPILCALQRQTKSLWRMHDDGFISEAIPPYRACQLPEDAIQKWKKWLVTGTMECAQWQVELVSNQARDGHSLIQRRHATIRRKPRRECEELEKSALSAN